MDFPWPPGQEDDALMRSVELHGVLVDSTNPELSLSQYLQPELGQYNNEDAVATPSAPTLQRTALQQTDYTPMVSFSSLGLPLISSSVNNDQNTLPGQHHTSTTLHNDDPMGDHRQPVPARIRFLDANKPADSPSPTKQSRRRYPWEDYKDEIFELYIRENKKLEDVMVIMQTKGFSPCERSFRNQLENWGIFKNNKPGKGRCVPDYPYQRPRTRQQHPSPASPSRPLPPARNEETSLVRSISEMVDRQFASAEGSRICSLLDGASAGQQPLLSDNPWREVYVECRNVSLLRKAKITGCLFHSLTQVFRKTCEAKTDTGPMFLVYFWRIAVILRDIPVPSLPAFDPQLPEKAQGKFNGHGQFLGLFLKYLLLLWSESSQQHPVYSLVRWLVTSFEEPSHILETGSSFKADLGVSCVHAVKCLEQKIGSAHKIVLSMESDHAAHWRKTTPYKWEDIQRDYFEISNYSLLTDQGSLQLMLAQMEALAARDTESGAATSLELADHIRTRTKAHVFWPIGSSIDDGLYLWSFSQAMRLLSKSLYKKSTEAVATPTSDNGQNDFPHLSKESFSMRKSVLRAELDSLIEKLRIRDDACRIQAALFSLTLSHWDESMLKFNPPRVWKKGKEELQGQSLPIAISRQARERTKQSYTHDVQKTEERCDALRRAQKERHRLGDILKQLKTLPILQDEASATAHTKEWKKEQRNRRRQEQRELYQSVVDQCSRYLRSN